ncbi:MAG TPA: hypothetical protein VK530_03150, partial [Candidatus Acidoferrum sp.]|nr:hypothetical protein [Candidatus Acidoferrum sp.]
MKFKAFVISVAALFLVGCHTSSLRCCSASRFDFALIGDTPYNAEQTTNQFPNLVAELNAAKLEFVV